MVLLDYEVLYGESAGSLLQFPLLVALLCRCHVLFIVRRCAGPAPAVFMGPVRTTRMYQNARLCNTIVIVYLVHLRRALRLLLYSGLRATLGPHRPPTPRPQLKHPGRAQYGNVVG